MPLERPCPPATFDGSPFGSADILHSMFVTSTLAKLTLLSPGTRLPLPVMVPPRRNRLVVPSVIIRAMSRVGNLSSRETRMLNVHATD